MHNLSKFLIAPYLLWMIIFIIIPVLSLVYFSFIDISGHFSFTNYRQVFSVKYLKMMWDSIFYAALITIITPIISYPITCFVRSSKFQDIWLLILIIPTWANLLLRTYAFIGTLSHEDMIDKMLGIMHIGPLNSLSTSGVLLLVASYIYIPLMVLPIFNSMKSIPNNLLQTSSGLGTNTSTISREIILPLTKEGVMTGVQAMSIPALSLFMIIRLIAGNRVISISTSVEEQFLVVQNYGMGSTIAIFLIVFMAFILIITKSKETNGRG